MSKSNQSHVLLVDGHSIIFQWPELKRIHQTKSLAARQELIRLMTRFQDITGWHVALVFDGKGAKAELSADEYNIQVFYSQAGQTADSIIERLTAKYITRYNITVATDDLAERETITALGAHWMSSTELNHRLNEINQDLEEALRQRRNSNRRIPK